MEAQNDVNGAAGRLQLDGLRAERWLAAAASEQATLDALSKASASARGEAATQRCEDLFSKMKNAPLFEKNVPTLVALVDASGKIVGRNGTNMNRGDDMAGDLRRAEVDAARPGSRAPTSGTRRTAYLASYVAVHDSTGAIIGALVAGRPLNDTLSRVSEATTGRALDLIVPQGRRVRRRRPLGACESKPLDDAIAGRREGHAQERAGPPADRQRARRGPARGRLAAPVVRGRQARAARGGGARVAHRRSVGAGAAPHLRRDGGRHHPRHRRRLAARRLHHAAHQHARGGAARHPQRPGRQALRAGPRRARRARVPHRSAARTS